MSEAPSTFKNPRGDNPWDNDAVHWLLTHPDVSSSFKRGALMECLRRQPNRVKKQPRRVAEAEVLAQKYGVIQRDVFDPTVGKLMVRLIRTDPAAPDYPW